MDSALERIISLLKRIDDKEKDIKALLSVIDGYERGLIAKEDLIQDLKTSSVIISEKRLFGEHSGHDPHNPYNLFNNLIKEFEKEKNVKIGNLLYEFHALKKMEERHIFPMVVEDAIKNGEHYSLGHVNNPELTRGATDVYIKRHVADIVSKEKVGERILKIFPERKRKYFNVLVFTKGKVVKTIYLKTDKGVDSFFRIYIERRRKVA